MTEAERKQILAMISEGKITAEEGYDLISSLNEEPDDAFEADESASAEDPDEALIGVVEPEAYGGDHPEFDENTRAKMERSKTWWDLAAGVGLVIVIVSAYGMYAVQTSYGLNFWFFTLFIPLLLGVLLLIIGLPNKQDKWVFVQVVSPDAGKMIVFSFPLSIVRDLLGFGLRFVPVEAGSATQEFFDAITSNQGNASPIFVNVDDEGSKVQIFIG